VTRSRPVLHSCCRGHDVSAQRDCSPSTSATATSTSTATATRTPTSSRTSELCVVAKNPALPDADGDGVSDGCDRCSGTASRGSAVSVLGCDGAQVDPDGDGVCSGALLDIAFCTAAGDNCDTVPNRNQQNSDSDGLGNVCENATAAVGAR
jgi:hypothetical protein